MTTAPSVSGQARLKLAVRGAVQGVGFRPFVFRLAEELGLSGWVGNSPQGVFIEVEGVRGALESLLLRLDTEKPPGSFIQSLEVAWLEAVGHQGFTIRESKTGGDKTALVMPDIATCPDCLRELLDPANRRYRYPFTNCTHCGPRFSIIEALPYDRANTTMKGFTMCPACQAEYEDPRDRRFHAQPNACPICGPQLELWRGCFRESAGNRTSAVSPSVHERGHAALLGAAGAIRAGQIVAVKGIGGFHLLVDARNESAVCRLRDRKHREEKPFALMFPTLESVQAVCEVSPLEERLLCSSEAPIVLLKKRSDVRRHVDHPNTPLLQHSISSAVAPGNPHLGVMLPSNPLHHLLLAELGFPVVATSGNLSDEPLCIDEREACERLEGIADVFLVHNRPIVRQLDDSLVRVMMGREMMLRRARGYAPLPIQMRSAEREARNILAVGAHLKNSVALAVRDQVFLSQHIGDLETELATTAFRRVAADLPALYGATPEIIAADLHPDYLSTQFAEEQEGLRDGAPGSVQGDQRAVRPTRIGVQHHIAHVLSCMADNELDAPVLGISWDGTGYGLDGTIWGGEFFHVTENGVQRVAHLRPFQLPGGEAAVKEPRRAALGLLYELYGNGMTDHYDGPVLGAFGSTELAALTTMLTRGLNSPWCGSVGRLFDAVASLCGLRQQLRFEGQAAMELEFALEGVTTTEAYASALTGHKGRDGMRTLDWAPMITALHSDVRCGVSVGEISARFHNTLVEWIARVAGEIGEERVVLSGGCFQNRPLLERTVQRLRAEGFRPCWHQRVPPNDGGIALGQIVAARRQFADGCEVFTSLEQRRDNPGAVSSSAPSSTGRPPEIQIPLQPITNHA